MFHSLPATDGNPSPSPPPSIIELGYTKTISTSSMSKTYSLAGIRLGWIATPDAELVQRFMAARDYTTIAVSQLDDQVATFALSDDVLPNLLERNIQLAKTNLNILDKFVQEYQGKGILRWVKPTAGTTAIIEIRDGASGKVVEDGEFCLKVFEETGVLIVPASKCFGGNEHFKGHVRIGYVCETEVLVGALEALRVYFKKNLNC